MNQSTKEMLEETFKNVDLANTVSINADAGSFQNNSQAMINDIHQY